MYPVLGDQDFSPPGQARPQGDPLYLAAAELWQTWLPPKAIDTFKLGQSATELETNLRDD